ncbi:CPBP family intramembrane glutamic endopeptidase [Flagellimonas myxillae]|uniref:CPBP family intramembrane glutamic endopeptidase n=1 Tax=Flagellimonas myxillae TaxID=2942214 RepID=UPI00201F29DB|nr:type II CAAX endopeptidase family protein [Muricauda myxillae]MCL6267191.1 CPBP family intramembrane metalloprotease [Muricauda myxillae]
MKQKLRMKNHNWKLTLCRVLLFCLCTVLLMILSSSLTNALPKPWSDILHITISAIAVLGINIPFARWEKLNLAEIGVVPNGRTIKCFTLGFAIGCAMVTTFTLWVVFAINSKLIVVQSPSFSSILIPFLLYFVVSLREELAFRAFPLRSLNYAIGSWKSQIIIALIFAIEHMAGGMTFIDAFLGSGVGAILFGIAALTTKGIALPAGIHLAWNFGQRCFGFKNEPGIVWEHVIIEGSEAKNEPMVWIAYLTVMGLSILGFYLYGRKKTALQDA